MVRLGGIQLNKTDRSLGMNRNISRRDFIGGSQPRRGRSAYRASHSLRRLPGQRCTTTRPAAWACAAPIPRG
jgi:hypothetical protein